MFFINCFQGHNSKSKMEVKTLFGKTNLILENKHKFERKKTEITPKMRIKYGKPISKKNS